MTACVDGLNVIVRSVIPPDIGEDVFAPPELRLHAGREVLHQRVADLRDNPLQFGKVFFVNLKHQNPFLSPRLIGFRTAVNKNLRENEMTNEDLDKVLETTHQASLAISKANRDMPETASADDRLWRLITVSNQTNVILGGVYQELAEIRRRLPASSEPESATE